MKVLIADDHPLYREAAALQVRRLYAGSVVEEVASLDELRDALARTPDCNLVLADYYMPGMSSAALAKLVNDYPDVPLAVISGSARNDEVLAAVKAGVKGYIPKTAPSEHFAHALQMLLAGGSSIPTDILLSQPVEAVGASWLNQMSDREQEVLRGVAQGQSNKEIGRALGLAEVTIKLHLRNVFRKMDVKSRSEAAVKAVKAGLG